MRGTRSMHNNQTSDLLGARRCASQRSAASYVAFGSPNETARAVVWRRGGGDGSALSDDRSDSFGFGGHSTNHQPLRRC
jgi:hypothetical protein